MALDWLLAVRGLLAFIAFTEWTAALRCVFGPVETGSSSADKDFVSQQLFANAALDANSPARLVVGHAYALSCVITGLVVAFLAVFTHYKPIQALAVSVTASKLLFLLSHLFLYKTISGEAVVFQVIACVVALLVSSLITLFVDDLGKLRGDGDENTELLRRMKFPKKAKKAD
jgi:hypothetical protein